jgi:hypothetical protein
MHVLRFAQDDSENYAHLEQLMATMILAERKLRGIRNRHIEIQAECWSGRSNGIS